MRLSIFVIIVLLILYPSYSLAQNQDMYCSALDDSKTYKNKQSYKYLLVGSDGWLFRSKKDFKEDFLFNTKTLENFSKFNNALKNNGVNLYIVMPPTRGLMHGDKLSVSVNNYPKFNKQKAWNSYYNSIKQLQDIGLSVASFDGVMELGGEFYYKRDHHWTLSGADFSAKNTAKLFEGIKKDIPETYYKTDNTNEIIELNGSFEGFVEKACDIQIPNEKTELVKTYKDNDLFIDDDSVAKIALVGTSNCTEPNPSYANFAGYLREYIGADVDNASIAGGGIDTPMLAYLASNDYRNKKHKHIIWELASHYDFNGDEFKPIFKQIIPAAKGECNGSATVEKELFLSSEKIDLDIDSIDKNSYIYLKFDNPINKDFALSYKNSKGNLKRFRFKRSDRYPNDGIYFYEFDEDRVSNLFLLMSKNYKASKVFIEVCPSL